MSPLEEKGFCGNQVEGWIHKIRTDYKRWFDLADEVNKFCHSTMFQFSVTSDNGQAVLAANLYIRCISSYQGVIILSERGMIPQARALARVLLEALFPLAAICADDGPIQVQKYIQQDWIRRKKGIKRILDSGRVPSGTSTEALQKAFDSFSVHISDNNIKEIKVKEWAKAAGLIDHYNSSYQDLNDSVHTNVADLQRHNDANDIGEIVTLNWGPDPKEIEATFMHSIDAMLLAYECGTVLFGNRDAALLAAFRKRLDDLTDTIPI
jgi:hypothetical protein